MTSPQAPEPRLDAPASFDNQTIRQVVYTSIAGRQARVRLSNEYGSTPLVIGAASLALHAGGAAIVPGTDKPLTFSGRRSITIAPGAPAISDPIDFDVPALGNVVVSIHLPRPTPVTTLHRRAFATSYVSTPGDYTDAVVMPTATTPFVVLPDRSQRGGGVQAQCRDCRVRRFAHGRHRAVDAVPSVSESPDAGIRAHCAWNTPPR